ncbi:MAG: hypothetical protein SFW66_10170 [Gammaproteobacteria bacterium]|nr:hypothetical protein [Gammaproteobacteria bacterium]
MRIPLIKKLNIPELIDAASHLKSSGKLARSQNNLIYLDIENAYIHQLFPLLQNQQIKVPDYFGKDSAGAHITAIYPEENKKIDEDDLGKAHHFLIKDIVTANINDKIYYVLLVESPSLLKIRRKYGLSDQLCFKGYAIGFHITIGVK